MCVSLYKCAINLRVFGRCNEIPAGFRYIGSGLCECTPPFGTSYICGFCKSQNPSQSPLPLAVIAAHALLTVFK